MGGSCLRVCLFVPVIFVFSARMGRVYFVCVVLLMREGMLCILVLVYRRICVHDSIDRGGHWIPCRKCR